MVLIRGCLKHFIEWRWSMYSLRKSALGTSVDAKPQKALKSVVKNNGSIITGFFGFVKGKRGKDV